MLDSFHSIQGNNSLLDSLIHLRGFCLLKFDVARCFGLKLALTSNIYAQQVAKNCNDGSDLSHESSENEVSTSMINFLRKQHILMLYAGGDSKRVPWANPMRKVFLPLPYLADDDPDGPVPLLFDHILAIS
ncbi:hypothetical protein R6Q57_011871 [Mikania cordata]